VEKLKSALIETLRSEGLHDIADAVLKKTSDTLVHAQQVKLQDAASRIRQQFGLTNHTVDLGFAGTSPSSGSPGRFSEITE